tara:strand:- start:12720 stop:13817 length:1098 start_codon:yes stop_codon:yes gene_type:complete
MNKGLEIITLTKSQLIEAVEENLYWKNQEFSGFSKNKAFWIINSPRIADNDYCFFLAIENSKIVALISVIPDLIKSESGLEKVYWMTEWWVNDAFEKTVLPTYLFSEALKFTKNRILIKSYAENANDFYNKQPFEPIEKRLRHTIFLSLNPDSIIAKFKFLKRFRFFLNIANTLSLNIIALSNKNKIRSKVGDLNYEYLTKLDAATWQFIAPLCNTDLIYKSRDYIDWHLDCAQYLNTPLQNKTTFNAIIRGYSKHIDVFKIKVIKDGEIIGFISFLNFHGEVYLKYFLADCESNFEILANVLIEHLIDLKVSHIFTENQELVHSIKNRFSYIFMHSSTKTALAHKDLYTDLYFKEIREQDGHFI